MRRIFCPPHGKGGAEMLTYAVAAQRCLPPPWCGEGEDTGGLAPCGPSSPEQAPRNGVELGHQGRIACFRRRNEGIIEGAVRTDRAWLMLARKIARQPRHQALGLLGISSK